MDVAITKMSSKGQIVIPVEMRKGIAEGEKLLVIRKDDHLIMKKATKLDKDLSDDLEFAKRTEAAWKEYDKGNFITMDFDDFIKEMKKW